MSNPIKKAESSADATPDAGGAQSDEDILKIARQRFDLAVDAESDYRKDALDDLDFRAGKQWPDDVRNSREQDKRPCLTINRLPQFVNQITNDQRQNRPSIKVNPVDEDASIETAKVFQGLIRHIEYNSNADVAYDTAFEGAATKGLGYFRVTTDYCDADSFDQEIFIKRVRDSFSVYLDPHYQEPDASDAGWGFVFEDMSQDEFKAQFPDSELSKMHDWKSIGDKAPGWIKENTVRVGEYFYKSFKSVAIVQLSNGIVIEKSKLPAEIPPDENGPVTIVKERQTVRPAIKWCKINGLEILQKTDWLGQWIPIIPVLGAELIVNGKRILEGVVRHAKDPQRMYNYWATSETETIALAPRAPWVGYEGQFEGHEAQWKTANTKNHAYLEVKPTTIAGQPAPFPVRNTFEPPVQAISQARAQSSDDLKATTGIYDPTLGNRSNEISGVAIQRRNIQSQTSNFHYADNLTRALRHAGRVLIDLIPKIYDAPRTARLIGEDGSTEMVPVNQKFSQGGKDIFHDLSAGKYDVTVTTGPSYTTKRQEAAAAMLDFTKALPQTAQIVSDLIARNMDWPGAEQIADRLKKTLPPGIADQDDKNKQPIPPQAQAQMQQMDQMIAKLTQELTAASEEIKTDKFKVDSRERIEMAKIKANLEITMAELGADQAATMLKHEIESIKHRMDLLGANQPTGNGQGPGGNAADPSQVQQQPTGGQPPGQPMGA